MAHPSPSLILLICCPDRPGLIALVTRFIHSHGGNILDLDQHVDSTEKVFFMRVAWEVDGAVPGALEFAESFGLEVALPSPMTWSLHRSDHVSRLAVFVSSQLHCLYDILARVESGEWRAQIGAIVSNHLEARQVAERHGIAFHHLPITPENRFEREAQQVQILADAGIDLVVLARYMQVLSPGFVERYPNRIINIHHSFLPAFPGARPYHSAAARGVKVIGATSHYVTSELDSGPIIVQDVVRVSHRDAVSDLIRKGRDLEKIVLSRALWHHLEHHVLTYGRRTVVFE